MSISATSVSSIAGELKKAMLASWVEKPPSPTAEKAWQIASNHDMPQIRSATMPTAVMSAYTSHSELAVSVMRGVRRSSLTGPGVSALVQLHAADAQQRQHRDRQHDDAEAAEPVQRGTPEVERGRQCVEPGEHRRAGGGESRHGLEVRAGEAQGRQRQQERHRRRRRQEQPRERHQQEAVARLQLALQPRGGRGEQQSAAARERRRQQKTHREAVAHEERAGDGQSESEREGREQQSERIRDREQGCCTPVRPL